MIDKALKEEIKLNFKINEKQIPKFLLKKNLFANFSYATRNDLIRFTLKYQITKKEFKALYKKALIDDEYINCLVKFCFVNSYNFTSLKLFEKQIPANCLKNSYFINAYHDNYVIIDKFLSYLKNERDITEKLNLLIINSKLVEKYMNSSKLDVIYNNLEILPMLDRLCMIKGNKDINYYLENYTPMQIKKLCTLMTQVPAQNYELQQYIFRNYENIDSSYLDYLSTINYDFHQALKNENYSSLTQHFISFVLNEHLYQDINQSLTFLKSCYLDKKTAWQLDEILKDIDINKLSLEDKNIINYYNLIKQNNDKDKLQNLDEKFFQKLVKVCSAYRNIQYNENLLNSQDLNNFLTVTHKTVMTKDNKVKPVKVIELQGEFYKAYVHNIVNKNNKDSSISLI